MLKELRESDPMLEKFWAAISDPEVVKKRYSPHTIKSYHWHWKGFLQHCRAHNTTPKDISQKNIERYLKSIYRKVENEEKSRPYFLQACTTIELGYRTVVPNLKKADSIPMIRQKIAS